MFMLLFLLLSLSVSLYTQEQEQKRACFGTELTKEEIKKEQDRIKKMSEGHNPPLLLMIYASEAQVKDAAHILVAMKNGLSQGSQNVNKLDIQDRMEGKVVKKSADSEGKLIFDQWGPLNCLMCGNNFQNGHLSVAFLIEHLEKDHGVICELCLDLKCLFPGCKFRTTHIPSLSALRKNIKKHMSTKKHKGDKKITSDQLITIRREEQEQKMRSFLEKAGFQLEPSSGAGPAE